MNNNDNCGFVYNIERQMRETEEEFIYTSIEPFCETVIEKKLSKAELKQILKKGMQKSIPLDKVKQAGEEIENIEPLDFLEITKQIGSNGQEMEISKKFAIAILDNLIAESEGKFINIKCLDNESIIPTVKAIPIDRIKQAREEMHDLDYLINDAKYSDQETRAYNVDSLVTEFYEILDKLIAESEG